MSFAADIGTSQRRNADGESDLYPFLRDRSALRTSSVVSRNVGDRLEGVQDGAALLFSCEWSHAHRWMGAGPWDWTGIFVASADLPFWERFRCGTLEEPRQPAESSRGICSCVGASCCGKEEGPRGDRGPLRRGLEFYFSPAEVL